ncbi:MAG: MarR family transcriptional regulator [Desulfomonilaceae bacterium]
MKPRLNVFPRTESPGFVICQTSTCLKAGLHRAFQSEGYDITPEQWTVLSSLWEAEGVHQSLLAEKTAKDRHNIARILNLLEKSGLVRRQPDREDLRRHKVYLTDAGRALKPELVRVSIGYLQKAFAGVTQEDVNTLMNILRRILNNLGSDGKNWCDPTGRKIRGKRI